MMTSGRRARIISVLACTDCCLMSLKTFSLPAMSSRSARNP
jgi:hypothetical protein